MTKDELYQLVTFHNGGDESPHQAQNFSLLEDSTYTERKPLIIDWDIVQAERHAIQSTY